MGGDRTIHAPIGRLRAYQSALAGILLEIDAEAQKDGPRPLSHAYRKGQSIVTHASLHKNRRYVLNLDLQDFFPSFTFPRVRGFFIKDQRFGLAPECATILAQIACFQGALPQGSPCSPIISDLVSRIMDQRLARFAKSHKVTYSRYADDITFSTNAKSFPKALAIGGTNPSDPWVLGQALINKIVGSGFAINFDKTRMQVAASRQVVTGLTVNEKVNIPQIYWGRVRSMCQSLYKTGAYHRHNAPADALTHLDSLRGVLAHVYNIKSRAHIRPISEPGSQKKPPIIFGQKTHEDFHFYDYFVSLQQPLIITEGHTDPVYLRNAIRQLSTKHPMLCDHSKSGFHFKVRFFNYENTIHKLLRMGGSDPLKNLAITYEKRLRRYDYKPLAHPVIILLDSDSGLSGFSNAIQSSFAISITQKTTEDFYHLNRNLYVVKTPEPTSGGASCIEDLFGTFKSAVHDGRILHFDEKTFDVSKHISKSTFAKKIVAKQAGGIDWSGFEPLLNRIDAVLTHYKPPASPIAI